MNVRCIRRRGSNLGPQRLPQSAAEEQPESLQIRFRTLGDLTITGAVESDADTLEKNCGRSGRSRKTERGGRMDDKRSKSAMEDRKKEGYF